MDPIDRFDAPLVYPDTNVLNEDIRWLDDVSHRHRYDLIDNAIDGYDQCIYERGQ